MLKTNLERGKKNDCLQRINGVRSQGTPSDKRTLRWRDKKIRIGDLCNGGSNLQGTVCLFAYRNTTKEKANLTSKKAFGRESLRNESGHWGPYLTSFK